MHGHLPMLLEEQEVAEALQQQQHSEQASAPTTEQQAPASAFVMLQQMLQDLQMLGYARPAVDVAVPSPISSQVTTTAAECGDQQVTDMTTEPDLLSMLENAAAVLAGIAEQLPKQQLLDVPLRSTLKASWLHCRFMRNGFTSTNSRCDKTADARYHKC
jgi:hypothetical protein